MKKKINEINLNDPTEEQKDTAEAMQETNKDVKIDPSELDTLIGFIHKGYTLQQIAEELNEQFQPKKQEQTQDKPKRARKNKNNSDEQTLKEVTRLLQPIIHPPYSVSVGIRYMLDQKRMLELSATEPLSGRDLVEAQEEIYTKLLESLNFLINKS